MPKPKPKKPAVNTSAVTKLSSIDIANPRKDAAEVVAIVHRQAVSATVEARALRLETDSDLAVAAETLIRVKGLQKQIAAKKSAILDPLAVAVKEIRSLFAPAEASLANAESYLDGKMADYHRQRKLAEEKERRALAKRGDTETAVVLAPAKVITEAGTVTFAKHDEVVIVDAAKIPRRWLVPDMVAIRRAVIAGEEIPGVEKREGVSIR